MHYHAEIWIPDNAEVGPAVAAALAPHQENYDEETDKMSGFWDWFQIGGR